MTEPDFDLTIVGGGIVGAMVAWRALRRRPQWRVLWLDRSIFGLGASSYAGGLLTPFGRTPTHRALLTVGFKLLQDLEQETGALPLRELAGWYVVSPHLVEERRQWFIGELPELASAAQREDLRRLIPHLALDDRAVVGPFRVRQGRPTDFVSRIANHCRKSSRFTIWEGVQLKMWQPESDGIRLSFDGEPDVRTRRLALATGPWASRQLAGDSAFAGMRVKRVAACHIELAPAADAPVLYLGDHDSFLLPMPAEGRWLFGFPSESWDAPPEEFGSGMDERDRAVADSIIGEYSGAFKDRRRGGRAFYDCYREDWTPLAARVGGDPRIVFAGACAGSGFRLSPGLAEHAFDLLEAGEDSASGPPREGD